MLYQAKCATINIFPNTSYATQSHAGLNRNRVNTPNQNNIYHPLKWIARTATCKVVFKIVHTVPLYVVAAFKSPESRAPDRVLLSALQLISVPLYAVTAYYHSLVLLTGMNGKESEKRKARHQPRQNRELIEE